MHIKKKYTEPQVWVEQMVLDYCILTVSSDGEDLVGEDYDPWLVV